MTELYPMLIEPRYDERIWGGNRLATMLGKSIPPDRLIGESWEVYDENRVGNGAYAGKTVAELRTILGHDLTGHVSSDIQFPLLTKLIDAQDVLSVQVHPDDHFAQLLAHEPNGKTECWYIIAADPGASITYGFARGSNPQEYEALVERGMLEEVLRSLPVKAGDVVFIPAGTVHAIGAGILLFELQQTSDITYRIYDWNRHDATGNTRELHVEQAERVLDYHQEERGLVYPLHQAGAPRTVLVAALYFALELVETEASNQMDTHQSAVALCAMDNPISVTAGTDTVELSRYSSVLIPAAARTYSLRSAGGGPARALVAYVPVSPEDTRDDLRRQGYSDAEIDAFLAQFAPARDLGQPAAV